MAMLGALGAHLTVGTRIEVEAPFGHLTLSIGEAEQPATIHTGNGPAFFRQFVNHIDHSQSIDLAVAFVMESGLVMLEPYLRDLLARGGRLRLVVGDYLDVSEPAALRRLSDLPGDAACHVFETAGGSFHPKAWLFRAANDTGTAIVGSSNLTRTALSHGIEWNLSVARESDWEPVGRAFEELLLMPQVKPITPAWIDTYAARRRRQPLPQMAQAIVEDDTPLGHPEPHEIQREALAALMTARANGNRAGLAVLATGLTERCLVYVALTRARDLLIVEWPDFCKADADTVWSLLVEEGGLMLGDDAITVDKSVHPAQITIHGEVFPNIFSSPITASAPEPRICPGRREYPGPRGEPLFLRPSDSHGVAALWLLKSCSLGTPLPKDAFRDAGERGTALHLAMRVLLRHPERADRLGPATGLEESTLAALKNRPPHSATGWPSAV
ncbi:hypothetical protein GLR48_17675 [Loktanella sp. M215]|nr:hypothetical protein [Loktanella sp. M215]